MRPRARFLAAALAVGVLGVWPLALVAGRAMEDLALFWRTVAGPEAREALVGTLVLSCGATLVALLLGAPAAWLTTRTDIRGRGFFASALALPYVVPPYIAALAWITLADPDVGLLNRLLGRGAFDIFSMGGLVWVLGLSFYPYVFLTVRAALQSADPALEDAARMSGAGPWRVVRDIALPLARPALLSSGGLVFMATASAFGAPVLIGNRAGLEFLSTRIFDVGFGDMGSLGEASSLACLLFAFALVPLLVRGRQHAVLTGKAARPTRVTLGRARAPVEALLALVVMAAVVLPVGALALTSFLRVAGDLRPSNFTLEKFGEVLGEARNTRALFTSLGLAAGAATICAGLGFLLAWLQVKTKLRGRHVLAGLAALPLATPGTVLALGLFLAWLAPIRLVYTVWILLIAYVAKHVALAARALAEGIGAVDDALPEAARLSGAKGLFLLRTIWLPLVLPSLLAAWFLVFMPSFSELTMSVILMGPEIETIGIRMYRMREYSSPTSASVLATLVLVLVLGGHVVLRLLARRRYGGQTVRKRGAA
ncbi:MAG: iron ABC transporter permease [Planctomycetota bacterium]|nr:iron ABC transporter permease [Planctomycetota bacterium]